MFYYNDHHKLSNSIYISPPKECIPDNTKYYLNVTKKDQRRFLTQKSRQ
jgi:hypothetical protein